MNDDTRYDKIAASPRAVKKLGVETRTKLVATFGARVEFLYFHVQTCRPDTPSPGQSECDALSAKKIIPEMQQKKKLQENEPVTVFNFQYRYYFVHSYELIRKTFMPNVKAATSRGAKLYLQRASLVRISGDVTNETCPILITRAETYFDVKDLAPCRYRACSAPLKDFPAPPKDAPAHSSQ